MTQAGDLPPAAPIVLLLTQTLTVQFGQDSREWLDRGKSFLKVWSTKHIFADSRRESPRDLINEMILSYLERSILPRIANRVFLTAAEALFPNYTPDHEHRQWDILCRSYFTRSDTLLIKNLDVFCHKRKNMGFPDVSARMPLYGL